MQKPWLSRMVDTCHNLPALLFAHNPKPTEDISAEEERGSSSNIGVPPFLEVIDCGDEPTHLEEEPYATAETGDHDNFLRGELLAVDRVQRLHDAHKVAISYWRHGSECACRSHVSEEFHDIMRTPAPYADRLGRGAMALNGELETPGMGLEMECLSSFLARSTKERLVSDYHIKSATSKKYSESAKFESRQANDDESGSVYCEEDESQQDLRECEAESFCEQYLCDDETEGDERIREQGSLEQNFDEKSPDQEDLEKPAPDETDDNGVDDQEITQDLVIQDQNETQDLSAADIERNQLIEAFEQSLIAARNALLRLACDSDEQVRAIVAQEYFCPVEALDALSRDQSEDVRLGVISNPNVSLPTLEVMSHDENPEVAQAARIAKHFRVALQPPVQV
jgi:hypothetical protein